MSLHCYRWEGTAAVGGQPPFAGLPMTDRWGWKADPTSVCARIGHPASPPVDPKAVIRATPDALRRAAHRHVSAKLRRIRSNATSKALLPSAFHTAHG
jgi:hypothetical protein